MNNKMTAKEFKEILRKADINFNIMGYEGILNIICVHYFDQANREEKKGLKHASELYRKQAMIINNELEKLYSEF